jgi:hypothetical protein
LWKRLPLVRFKINGCRGQNLLSESLKLLFFRPAFI